MHNEDDILPYMKDSDQPDGNWIDETGRWQVIVNAKLDVHQVGRNPCACGFCKGLRAKHHEARTSRVADVLFPETKGMSDEGVKAWVKQHVYFNPPGVFDDDGDPIDAPSPSGALH
jgi:hypothetical protein